MPRPRASREQIRRCLRAFDLECVFDSISHADQERLRQSAPLWYEFRETATFQAAPLADALRQRLRTLLAARRLPAETGATDVSLAEFIGIVVPMASTGRRASTADPESEVLLSAAVERVGDALAPTFFYLLDAIELMQAQFSRPDCRLYSIQLLPMDAGRVVIGLDAMEPVRRHVTIDGKPRPVSRCVRSLVVEEPEPVTWVPEDLPPGALRDPTDLYVQGHALDRLAQRVDFPELAGIREEEFVNSLAFPDAEVYRGSLLVRCIVLDQFVGYAPITFVDGIAVATTFLLNTMAGTPTGDLLAATLRARRADVPPLDRLSSVLEALNVPDSQFRHAAETAGLGRLAHLRNGIQGIGSRVTLPHRPAGPLPKLGGAMTTPA